MFDLHAGKKRTLSVAGAVATTVVWDFGSGGLLHGEPAADGSAVISVAGDGRGEEKISCTGKLDTGVDFVSHETANVIDAVIIPPTEVPMTVGDEVSV